MSILTTKITISNPLASDKKRTAIGCVVNRSLYTHLMIGKEIAQELGLKEIEKRLVKIGNAQIEEYSYVGPVEIEFGGRTGFTGALIQNEEGGMCHFGSIVMNELDMVILEKPLISVGLNPETIEVAHRNNMK